MSDKKPRKTRKKTGTESERLTASQEAFCQAYVLNDNGAASYAKAFPKSRKWKPQSRAQKASELLATGKIRGRIAALRSLVTEKAEREFEISAGKVLQEMAKIGFANMLDYVRTTSSGDAFVDLSQLDRVQAAAISEVTVEDFTEGRGEDARDVRRIKFKLHDKGAALHKLGLHLGLFKQTIEGEIGGKGGGPIVVQISDAEAKV